MASAFTGIETGGDTVVVGVNKFTTTEPSPLTTGEDTIMVSDPEAEADQIARLNEWRASRDEAAVQAALADLRAAARDGRNVMPPSIAAAKAGATTGEWGETVRAAFGQYRGPTGVARAQSNRTEGLEDVREAVDAVSAKLGRKLKFVVGKPGLDGHSNGAEQIAARARDCGMEIAYEGIRLTPAEIVAAVRDEDAHVVGLSILSGSHIPLMGELVDAAARRGAGPCAGHRGRHHPRGGRRAPARHGRGQVYTPKDFKLNQIMMDIVALVDHEPVAAE